jgi:hypothetical protein
MIPIQNYEGSLKRCCFCRIPTSFWTELKNRSLNEQVACCPECAYRALPDDVPTKKSWVRREFIAKR